MLNKLLTTTEKQNLHKRDVLMQDLLYYTLPLRKFTARGPRPWHRKRGCLAQKTGVPGTENGGAWHRKRGCLARQYVGPAYLRTLEKKTWPS